LAKQGVATQVAATLLATTGDNPVRVRTEASFAALCGASPVDASSGKQIRHRLNRGGDRQANSALWTITMTRLAHDPRTKAYLARRSAEGKTKKEIIRCLKRYRPRNLQDPMPAKAASHGVSATSQTRSSGSSLDVGASGEHFAGRVCAGAKTRERQRQNGVPEICSKAPISLPHCLAGSCPGAWPASAVIGRA
jgi:transposase